MPMFDLVCDVCGYEMKDAYVSSAKPQHCGQTMASLWTGFPAVIDDTIPGGETIENLAPTPPTFYSRSEKRLYLKQHGIREKVRHVGLQGSDKSPHTTRWACPPAVLTEQDEQARVAHWHAHEAELKTCRR
jgi:hypothetical protein